MGMNDDVTNAVSPPPRYGRATARCPAGALLEVSACVHVRYLAGYRGGRKGTSGSEA